MAHLNIVTVKDIKGISKFDFKRNLLKLTNYLVLNVMKTEVMAFNFKGPIIFKIHQCFFNTSVGSNNRSQ